MLIPSAKIAGTNADIGLLGVPFDNAVIAGGGRGGAKGGPDAIRKALKCFGSTYFIDLGIDISSLKIVDFGDIEVFEDVQKTHKRVTNTVLEILEAGVFPIVLGGGHDISFGNIRALSKIGEVGGVNIDAHFDVRPVEDGIIKSGCPFWMALESFCLDGKRFVELGMTGNCNLKEHYDYLIEKGSTIISLENFRKQKSSDVSDNVLEIVGNNSFLSLDIDAVQQAFAPGCSAPAPVGFTPDEIKNFIFDISQSSSIRLFDIMETNPLYDVDGRTSRLIASILSYFFAGYSLR